MPEYDNTRLRPGLGQLNFHQLRQLARALRREAASARGVVVDLGCGDKPYVQLFGGRYVGVDRSTSHGHPDILGVAEALPLRDGSVDVALSTQSLEHVNDPGLLLDEAHRALRPGGTLLLSTHGVWVHHPDPHDYWRWTEEGLRRLMGDHGFEVLRVHRQCEVILTGALLSFYPIGALASNQRRGVQRAAVAAIAMFNILGFAAEAVARALPRHYASVSYLVVARAGRLPA
jgi:SAM-dependent methyltransferase